ncbi:uncharacterized protein LOC117094469 [Trachypithecus francoisi]|uniref:uncharacterized protein LOC117094469 n=1 Tax=Trachypithecus francoisi TaxID=54180 RepID=UPI00141B3989|nr:uncharacterized protein LOC117094469 [Trachypithecus francoisi]
MRPPFLFPGCPSSDSLRSRARFSRGAWVPAAGRRRGGGGPSSTRAAAHREPTAPPAGQMRECAAPEEGRADKDRNPQPATRNPQPSREVVRAVGRAFQPPPSLLHYSYRGAAGSAQEVPESAVTLTCWISKDGIGKRFKEKLLTNLPGAA